MKKTVMRFLNIAVSAAVLCSSVFAVPSSVVTVESSAEISDVYIPEQIAYSFSEYETFEGINFVLSNDGTLTVSGEGAVISIPSEIDETAVKKLVLEYGITAVGEFVFYGCESLSKITVPDTLFYIGEKAFDNTAFLSNKADGAVYIGNVLYTYKGEIENDGEFALKDGTLGIADNALFARTEITEISIPDTVKAIGKRAFYGCTGLESIAFGEALSYVGSQAFYDTPWLEAQNGQVVIGKTLYEYKGNDASVEVGNTVEYISGNAFSQNTAVTEIVLADSVKYIGENAFADCTNLENISFGTQLSRVGANAFFGTKWIDNHEDGVVYASNVALTYKGDVPADGRIEIKDGTITLENGLFENMKALHKLVIPESVTYIGKNAFEGCLNLTVYTPEGSYAEKYALENGVTVYTSEIAETVVSSGKTDTYTWTLYKDGTLEFDGSGEISALPTEIDKNAVASLELSDGITAIGGGVFDGTKWLSNAPSGVVYAGKVLYKYKGASTPAALTSVTVKDGTVSISDSAFVNVPEITQVVIPDSVVSIGKEAFKGCENLETVTGGENVEYIGNDAFYKTEWFGLQSDGEIYLGKTLYAYKGDAPDGTIVNIADGTVSISDAAFLGLLGLYDVTFPDSLTTIGNEAFAYCENLGTVTVPVTVENIGENAFDGCDGIVLSVVRGSAAHEYAKSNGIAFEFSGFVIGDINEDAKVNVKDAILLSQYLAGNAELTQAQLDAADVYTDDGEESTVTVNENDLTHLAKYLAGINVVLG